MISTSHRSKKQKAPTKQKTIVKSVKAPVPPKNKAKVVVSQAKKPAPKPIAKKAK